LLCEISHLFNLNVVRILLLIKFFLIACKTAIVYPQKVLLHRSSFQKWSSRSNSSSRIPPDRRYVVPIHYTTEPFFLLFFSIFYACSNHTCLLWSAKTILIWILVLIHWSHFWTSPWFVIRMVYCWSCYKCWAIEYCQVWTLTTWMLTFNCLINVMLLGFLSIT